MHRLVYDPGLTRPGFCIRITRSATVQALCNKMGEASYHDARFRNKWRLYKQDGEGVTEVTSPIPDGVYPITVVSVPCVLVIRDQTAFLFYKNSDTNNLILDIRSRLNNL